MSEEANKPAPVEAAAPEANATPPKPADADAAAESKPEGESKGESKPMLKTTAELNKESHAENVKSDPTALPETDDPVLIRGQVEYYFGDSNLPRDKFMWEATGGEENKPVPLKTICSFKRMRRFQPYASVVAALRESTILDVVGEEGAETLRRKNPYKSSSERKRQQEANTLYVKGFGDEVATTQFDIEAFFARHGPVNYLKLRRTPERLFKGSVFVEFPDTDAARKFAESAPKWDGHDLKIMTKHEYCEEKSQLIREGKIQPSSSSRAFFEGREGPSKRGGRGGFQKNGGDKRGGHGGRGGGFRGRGGGRGRGRGRGRGGRGGRDDRGDRSEEAPKETSNNDVKPRINAGEPPKDAGANGKRAREDDGGATAPPAKKVDVES